jgi:hypothetical protein
LADSNKLDRRSDDIYNELILEELKVIKTEFTTMRKEMSDIKKDMLDNANSCGQKHSDLGNVFVHQITFWKIIGILLFLLSGSYAYTSVVWKILLI